MGLESGYYTTSVPSISAEQSYDCEPRLLEWINERSNCVCRLVNVH